MSDEPRNPFYDLLVAVSVVFVVTVLAYALVPPQHQPTWFFQNGWIILLVEVAAVVVLGLLSMGLDRWRTLRQSPSERQPPPS
ncbi:MAG: hypothetical protein NZM31_04820 [Gemmatales bacterium]|nr:hypothetical protein [Gemmatales bacterium]MDW8386320.1 hypothetical protein [Gemmatales bacterium]